MLSVPSGPRKIAWPVIVTCNLQMKLIADTHELSF